MPGKVTKVLLGGFLIGAAFIPGLGAVLGVGLKGLFLATGLGLASNALLGLRGLVGRQGTVLQNSADTQNPLPVVYGRAKVGLRIVDMRTAGTDNRDLYIVGALCHGSEGGGGIEGIDEIYFNDRLATDQFGVVQPEFAGKLTVTRYLGNDTQSADAVLAATFPAAWPTTSAGRGVAYLILTLTYDLEVYPTGIPTVTAMVRGCKVRDPANLGAARVYSTNPAWCIYDYFTSLRFGAAIPDAEMNGPAFALMATYYNTVVTKDTTRGTTGPLFTLNGWLDVAQSTTENLRQLLTSCRGIQVYEGGQYRIYTRQASTPTSFALTEATIVGEWSVQAPGIGEAPNSLRGAYVEPRDGPFVTAMANTTPIEITTDVPHGFLTGQLVYLYLVGASQGLVPRVLGQFTIAVTTTTTFTLDGTNERETTGIEYIAGSTRCTVEPFPFQPENRIWPRPGTANGFLTEDNTYEVIEDVALPFTTDPYTAEQILLVTLKEKRAGVTVGLTATEAALSLQVGDVVPVTHPTPGWVAKNFWVMGLYLLPDQKLVRLALVEYDLSAYTLDPLSTVPTPPSTLLPNPFRVAPPGNILLEAGDAQAQPDRDGTHQVYIRASWGAAPDPYLAHYEVEFRVSETTQLNSPILANGLVFSQLSGPAEFQPVPDRNRADTEALIGPVTEGVRYDVQVRAVNTLGRTSDWVVDSITPRLDTVQRSGSFWIDDFSSQTPGRRWVPVVEQGGTLLDTFDPDSLVGGKVGRCTGPVWYALADAIPFDSHLLYTMRWRVRQLRDPAVGDKEFFIGVMGLAEVPGQTGVYVPVNAFGIDSVDNQHDVVASGAELAAGRGWTDLYAHVQGYAGGKVALAASMLSTGGLGTFSAPNLTDGDTTPTKIGFDTDTAVAGASLVFDLVTPRTITEARLHLSAAGSTASWDLEYSDDGVSGWIRVT